MPTTPKFALPYPAPTAAPDVPYDVQQLAQQVEAAMQTLAVAQLSDATYPKAAAAVTAETVIDRISIAAAAYPRRILVDANAYMTASVAGTVGNLIIYADASVVGYGRRTFDVANGANELVATGHVDLAANVALVVEVRVSRLSGTGSLSSSNSSALTNTNVLMLRT